MSKIARSVNSVEAKKDTVAKTSSLNSKGSGQSKSKGSNRISTKSLQSAKKPVPSIRMVPVKVVPVAIEVPKATNQESPSNPASTVSAPTMKDVKVTNKNIILKQSKLREPKMTDALKARTETLTLSEASADKLSHQSSSAGSSAAAAKLSQGKVSFGIIGVGGGDKDKRAVKNKMVMYKRQMKQLLCICLLIATFLFIAAFGCLIFHFTSLKKEITERTTVYNYDDLDITNHSLDSSSKSNDKFDANETLTSDGEKTNFDTSSHLVQRRKRYVYRSFKFTRKF